MDKTPDRESEVSRFLWNMYHRRRMSGRMKLLLGAVGVVLVALVVGFENVLLVGVALFLLATFIGIGFFFGFKCGKWKGETDERKRMLDEGYSLGDDDTREAEDSVKPLRTCSWCGHVIEEHESSA